MNKRVKIRFYHWWIYRLYFYIWTPILKQNPQMVRAIRDWNGEWLKNNAVPKSVKKESAKK